MYVYILSQDYCLSFISFIYLSFIGFFIESS